MKDLRIVTIVDLSNYGNRLQNYALKVILERLAGRRVQTIRLSDGWLRDCLASARRVAGAVRHRRLRRLILFDRFTKEYVPTIRKTANELTEDGGFYVLGSDQIWNPSFSLGGRADGSQYAALVSGGCKFSYAASFGIGLEDFTPLWKERVRSFLATFEKLSVREKSGAEIVEQLSGLRAEVVLDPSLLLTMEEWRAVERKPRRMKDLLSEGYCVKFFLGEVDCSRACAVNEMCDKQGLRLIDLNDRSLSVGPSEFLYLIDHASLVCTDSFHAVAFSVVFRKPFVAFDRRSSSCDMSARFALFKQDFALASCFYDDPIFCGDGPWSIGWEYVEERIDTQRNRSLDFLRNGLGSYFAQRPL